MSPLEIPKRCFTQPGSPSENWKTHFVVTCHLGSWITLENINLSMILQWKSACKISRYSKLKGANHISGFGSIFATTPPWRHNITRRGTFSTSHLPTQIVRWNQNPKHDDVSDASWWGRVRERMEPTQFNKFLFHPSRNKDTTP